MKRNLFKPTLSLKTIVVNEIIAFILLLAVIISLIIIKSYNMSLIFFCLFYALAYCLTVNRFLSLFSLLILSVLFDTIINTSMGVSAISLLSIIVISNLEQWLAYKISKNLIVKCVLSVINIGILALLFLILSLVFNISTIPLLKFITITSIMVLVLMPITYLIARVRFET